MNECFRVVIVVNSAGACCPSIRIVVTSLFLLIVQIFLPSVISYYAISRTWSRSISPIHCKSHCDSCLTVSYHPNATQQEKCRQIDISKICRRQYLRSWCRTHMCDSAFPTTLVGFFSRFPGPRRFMDTKIDLFSTSVDEHDMQVAPAPAQRAIQEFWKCEISSR